MALFRAKNTLLRKERGQMAGNRGRRSGNEGKRIEERGISEIMGTSMILCFSLQIVCDKYLPCHEKRE